MKGLIAKILVNCAFLAALVAAESAYAQTRELFDEQSAPARAAPATVDDSCQTESYGPSVRVEPGDVIEDGEVVGRDPDPNIRTQLEREHSPGGYDEC
jgi:Flp pilus assembly protein TadD